MDEGNRNAPDARAGESAGARLEVHALQVSTHAGMGLLHPMSFALPTGVITALIGPEGAGKTLLLRTLFGLTPAAGRLDVAGSIILPDRTALALDNSLVLPTFPHDSFSTYGSARDAVDGLPNVRVSCPYYDDDTFLDLLEDSIRRTLDDWTPGDTVILCTAHSIPVSYVEKGDAYVDQVKRQVGALRQRLSGFRLELAFQSPIGPVKWVGPFLEEKLKDIADDGTRQVVVMPLSFTVDNSETCYELDMEVRELAGTMGIDGYRRVPCLNNDPGFRAFLLKKAEQELGRSNEQDKTVEAT